MGASASVVAVFYATSPLGPVRSTLAALANLALQPTGARSELMARDVAGARPRLNAELVSRTMVSLSLAFLAPIVLTGLLVKYRPADHEPPLFVPVSIVLVSYLPIAVIALLYAGVVLVDQRHLGNPVSNWAQGLLYLMVLLPPWLSFAGSIIAAGLLLSGRGSWKWNVAVLFVSVADLMLAASVVPSALGLS